MRVITRRRTQPIEDLRRAIDCLPVATRIAMLEGVTSQPIIVGAYVDRRGGVCPMLAAHRRGGRTDFLSFARAWDRFAGARGRARRATERELRVLTAHLQASLLADDCVDLDAAIADHRELLRRRGEAFTAGARKQARPGDDYRGRELRRREGWRWLRPFRRLDEYERALERIEAERDALDASRGSELELV